MIAANLFELTEHGNPDEPEAPPAPEGRSVSVASVSRANIADNVTRAAEAAVTGFKVVAEMALGTVKNPVGTWTDAVTMAESIGRFAAMPESSLSPLMAGRSTTYRFATFDLPFGQMKAAAKRRGDTVNDIFLGSVATGIARYHDRHGRPTRRLRFNIPISIRKAVKDGSSSNAVTIARFELPVNGVSMDERIKAAHDEVKRWRDEPALTLANPLADVTWLVPVPVLASAARASDVTASNVPGPPMPIYICGARMVGTWPLVPTVGAAANITMVTYDGTAFVGLSADETAIPDLDDFVADLRAGFAEVIDAPVGPADPVRRSKADQPSHAAGVREGGRVAQGGRQEATDREEGCGEAAGRKKAPAKKAPAKRAAAKKAPAKKAPAKRTAGPRSAPADRSTPPKRGAASCRDARRAPAIVRTYVRLRRRDAGTGSRSGPDPVRARHRRCHGRSPGAPRRRDRHHDPGRPGPGTAAPAHPRRHRRGHRRPTTPTWWPWSGCSRSTTPAPPWPRRRHRRSPCWPPPRRVCP